MIKSIKVLTIITIVFFLSSFAVINFNEFTGIYGVSKSDPSQIKLIINADKTFYFQDFSISTNKIVRKGSWSIKGKKIILNDADKKFHQIWTFEKNGQVAKSRKGLSFYRLCKMVD